jgi:protein-glutamine gamma-glutamyltransferase
MRLDARQFDLLALTVTGAVLLHSPHFPFWLNAALLGLVAARWLQRRLRPRWGAAPIWLRLPLTLALPVAVYLQFGNIFGLDPGSVFATGMLVLKLGESERVRDGRAVLTFAAFVLMAALLFEQGLLPTLYVGLVVLPLLVALRALEPDGRETPPPLLAGLGRESGAALLHLAAALPLAVLVFLFLPRLAAPLWATESPDQGRTGLGDSMAPGELSQLFLDDSPAFRVTFDAGQPPAPAQRYWRGVVLWRYDGRNWQRAGDRPRVSDSGELQARGTAVSYEITQEPTRKRWMFALDLPSSDPPGYARDADFTVVSSAPLVKLTQYRVNSALDYRLGGLSTGQRQRALALPPDFNPRSVALGKQWAQQYPQQPEAIIQAALDLIRDDFRYTLEPPPLGRHAMDDFLFETRAGYCEYFSSAFAVLMRAAGIPTRVVLGYQGGYWNDTAAYLLVRQSDAHAWNEVWLENRGWVRVDPTAAVRPERVELGSQAAAGAGSGFGGNWLLGLRNQWDVLNRLWTQVVVQFDDLSQRGLLRRFGVDQADWRQLGGVFAASLLLLAGLGLWWAMRGERGGEDALDRAYRRLCARLARLDLPRRPGEGPADYQRRVLQQRPQLRAALEPLFAEYVQLRYAQAEVPAAAAQAFARAVRRLELRPA